MHIELMFALMLIFVQNDQSNNIFFFPPLFMYAASLRFAFYFLIQDQAGWCN